MLSFTYFFAASWGYPKMNFAVGDGYSKSLFDSNDVLYYKFNK